MENLTSTCPNCQKKFIKRYKQQKYCSVKCKKHFLRKHMKEHPASGELIKSFICKKCGKTVYIYDTKDRRTKFCDTLCERRYFRHPHKKEE